MTRNNPVGHYCGAAKCITAVHRADPRDDPPGYTNAQRGLVAYCDWCDQLVAIEYSWAVTATDPAPHWCEL